MSHNSCSMRALGHRAYISGNALMPMLQLLNILNCMYCDRILYCKMFDRKFHGFWQVEFLQIAYNLLKSSVANNLCSVVVNVVIL